jgi:hypothetical protein
LPACFYATDIDTGTLGKGDDSLKRAGDIKGELLTVWGRQDPHVPLDGRNLIRARLEAVTSSGTRSRASTPSCVTRGRATTRPWPFTATGWCSNCSTAGSARATSPCKGPLSSHRDQQAGQIGNDPKPPLAPLRAWAAGVSYIDTALYYGFGQAESCVGDAMRWVARDEWVLSMKVGRLSPRRSSRRIGAIENGDTSTAPHRWGSHPDVRFAPRLAAGGRRIRTIGPAFSKRRSRTPVFVFLACGSTSLMAHFRR